MEERVLSVSVLKLVPMQFEKQADAVVLVFSSVKEHTYELIYTRRPRRMTVPSICCPCIWHVVKPQYPLGTAALPVF